MGEKYGHSVRIPKVYLCATLPISDLLSGSIGDI
nr:MAG TPA: hypothetical protein [Caudoviricetes sp.]